MSSKREVEYANVGIYNVTIVLDCYQFFKQKDIRAANNFGAMIIALTKLDKLGIKSHLLASTEITMEVRKQKSSDEINIPEPKINLLSHPHRENTINT